MICFKDKTFCSEEDCDNTECSINWRLIDKTEYNRWSSYFGDGGGPVALCNFNKYGCDRYVKNS